MNTLDETSLQSEAGNKPVLVIPWALLCLAIVACTTKYSVLFGKAWPLTSFMKDRFTIQTHPQWNFADFGCTDLRVSPVHLTWYQSSQSSHCTQSTSLSWLWGWRQSTDAHVLYMKLSSSAESLLLKDFRAAFLQVEVCFRRLLLAVEAKGGYQKYWHCICIQHDMYMYYMHTVYVNTSIDLRDPSWQSSAYYIYHQVWYLFFM